MATQELETPESAEPESAEPETSSETESESKGLLAEIANAELRCRSCESDVDYAKEALKEAKAQYDQSVIHLRKLANGALSDQDRPLFEPLGKKEEPETTWRDEPFSKLFEEDFNGLGDKKKDLILDQIRTMGEFEDLRCKVGQDADHLCKLMPKGIGESTADEIEERFLNWVTEFAPENSDLAGRLKQLNDGTEDWMDSKSNADAWSEGFESANAGESIDDCHYSEGDNQDDWLRGFASFGIESDDSGDSRDPGETEEDFSVDEL